MFKRFLGLLMIIIGLSGIWVGWRSAQAAQTAVDNIAASLQTNLELLTQSLDTVIESLALAKQTVTDVGSSLNTVEETADGLSQALDDTQPLLEQVSDIASSDVPQSIEAVQAAIPNMAEVAGAIDSTLTTLNRFKIDESFDIPNPFSSQPLYTFDLDFDLGIDYDPSVPFDETVRQLGASTEGLPAELRGLATHIDTSSQNLASISENVTTIGEDLGTVNQRIAELDPLLDEYIRLVTELNDQTRLVKAGMSTQLEGIQDTINIIMIWFILTQIAPLYLGYELLTGKRGTEKNA
ncbi:MAG: hypothetical protein H6658_14335 [Ardenticatenaceae bacterium]|nr:hypothetical protein [Ardenticatenaceae bacterium]